jgi:hypothetical protein
MVTVTFTPEVPGVEITFVLLPGSGPASMVRPS